MWVGSTMSIVWYTGTIVIAIEGMTPVHFAFSVPLFIKGLGGLKNVLVVAEKLAGSHEGGEASVLSTRLASDMFPLVRQIQIACDQAKGAAARLTGTEIPVYPDTETTIAELTSRIDRTIGFLESMQPAAFEGAGEREVRLPYFPEHHFLGDVYLKEYALPNFYFHVTTAYDIVRMLGGNLQKRDFLNGVTLVTNI